MRSCAIRLSEIREQINAGSIDGMPKEQLESLRKESISLEKRYREEILGGDMSPHPTELPGGHGSEVRSLLGQASLGSYISAAVENRSVNGAEAELQAALETRSPTSGGVMVPWEMIAPQESRAAVEHRVDTATTLGTSSGIGTAQDKIIQRVFAQTSAAFLNVRMVGVSVGQHSYPVITAGQTPDLKVAGAEHDSTAATISASVLEPKRLTARYTIRVEDIAKLEGYESAMRMDLQSAMGERLDHFVLNGDDATAPQWKGFFDALADPSPAPSVVATYADFLKAFGGGVDGRYSRSLAETKLLVGSLSYAHAASVVQAGSGMTAVQYASSTTGGMMASALVPAAVSDIQQAILAKTGPGAMDNSVCPTWPGVELIRDLYSGSSSGLVHLTSISLVDFALIRPAGYRQLAFKLA